MVFSFGDVLRSSIFSCSRCVMTIFFHIYVSSGCLKFCLCFSFFFLLINECIVLYYEMLITLACFNDKIKLSTSHENNQIRVIQLVFYGGNKVFFLF